MIRTPTATPGKRTRPAWAALALAALLCTGVASAAPADPGGELNALYWQGHGALGSGDWALAQRRFADLERRLRQSEPQAADAAIYWQAYAAMRAGHEAEARAAVVRLRQQYPRSRWNRDGALLLRGDGARAGAVVSGEDAIEALLRLPPAQAIPKLVAILADASSTLRTKQRALFLLSQMDDAGALAQVAVVARGRDPQLGERAVRMLAVAGADDALRQVYAAAPDRARQLIVLKALGVANDERMLSEVARSNADPQLRQAALQALGVAGHKAAAAEVARSAADPQTRIAALRALGTANATGDLLAIYPGVRANPALREAALKALLVAANEGEVLKLYHRTTDAGERGSMERVLREAGVQVSPRR
ncbi:hypothetical protein [Lysobacter silvisoli]|uniref:HEAT repeat domain-containing protein n=1 Tax=Lysobacter silvisoli TaxID=2293254 RepID=A0A371K0H5_9GAMM|nr:hypothetical protein [Lysobacter silvisoli]RDZ27416.1 hypothetical protein DX914_14395 [Lysobacter silvisoli]